MNFYFLYVPVLSLHISLNFIKCSFSLAVIVGRRLFGGFEPFLDYFWGCALCVTGLVTG